MPRTTNRNRGGRIRVTDDSVVTIGTDVAVRAEHVEALNATKAKESADRTRKGHRLRLKKLIEWWMVEYPDYFEVGTRILSQEERLDPTKFYHTCNRDIVYEGLRVEMVLAYMAATKKKHTEQVNQAPISNKIYSFTHMRKIHDAILFGARTAKKILSTNYYAEMDSFLVSFKKEAADARSQGNVDEKSADPITFSLFRMILNWAVEQGNLFVWVWTILQWNLMARSISIDPLALHNISISEDHFVFRHDSTKTDKEGEKIHNKAVYCNPLDPLVCTGVSLGIWLSLEQNSFQDNSEKIFLRHGAKPGSAAHRYCEQLLNIMKMSQDIVQTFITNMSAHGLRKGSATHVACATTAPPPIASIANRGDWSLGKVLDVYWQFAEVGDSYLGRCLCGLDPNHTNFSVLPPHWTVENPVDDPDIKEALHRMYGVIITVHPSSIAILVRLLASVAYASDWILATTARIQGHPFSAIPLLQTPELLIRLKAKVTTGITVCMPKATGIPPHVMQLNLMTSLLELCQTTLVRVNEQAVVTRQSIFDAMEERAMENGQISRDQIVRILEEFQNGIGNTVSQQIDTLLQRRGIIAMPQNAELANQQPNHSNPTVGGLFAYSGRFWDVPEGFLFPSGIKRDVGWKLWIQGMPAYAIVGENGEIVSRKIKPFRKLLPSRLPKKVADTFKLIWRPIFTMMEEGITGNVLASTDESMLTSEMINSLYNEGTDHLRTKRVSYIFDDQKFHHNDWTISTWSKYVSCNKINQMGNELDKRNLPIEARFNRPHATRRKRGRPRDPEHVVEQDLDG